MCYIAHYMTDRTNEVGLEKKVRSHVTLDEDLLKRAKSQAASEGRSFSSYVERCLKLRLDDTKGHNPTQTESKGASVKKLEKQVTELQEAVMRLSRAVFPQ